MHRRGASGWRWAGFWLALAVLALRVAIPPGFMLGKNAADQVVVTLCSGAGPVEGVLDLRTGAFSHKQQPTQDNGQADAPCAFAGLGAAVLTPTAPGLDAPMRVTRVAQASPLAARPTLTPTGPPLPARGPPLTA